ncbi:MAG TPA: methyltransferase domain-containing protein [Chitinophagaceae bacterium]|jgi:ubiquinone/menaquinone biosynthesis C-methylase UbiE|nr:methyltransferase domain-containing protein [Chitinophagaceae bacterium]
MKSTLLPEDKLIWSPIVANSRMNRERKASGINSYEKEFKFKPEVFLESKIKELGHASWLDLCCGQGNALIQTASYLHSKGLQDKVQLSGIDLLPSFQPIPKNITCLHFKSGSVVDWVSSEKYDLVTCSHGLHYLGNKLKVIETVIGALDHKGLFIANLDLANISIAKTDTRQFLKNFFKKEDIQYNQRARIIKRAGFARIKFNLRYIGADDKTGPNYTGQDAVTSYYGLR